MIKLSIYFNNNSSLKIRIRERERSKINELIEGLHEGEIINTTFLYLTAESWLFRRPYIALIDFSKVNYIEIF